MQLNLIKAHQGQRVTLNGFKDFAVLFETKHYINDRSYPLELVGLTKGGKAIVKDIKTGKEYKVPPTNITCQHAKFFDEDIPSHWCLVIRSNEDD